MDFPALAVSLETPQENHRTYSKTVDFSAAAYFCAYFARLLLEKRMPSDVHVLKVDVPAGATPQTPWEITRVSRQRYYEPQAPQRTSWNIRGPVGYKALGDPRLDPPDTDLYALLVKKVVSVTPLSLDLTSRVDLKELEASIRKTE